MSFNVENKGATAEENAVEHVDGHLVWSNQSSLFPIESQSLHSVDMRGGCKRKGTINISKSCRKDAHEWRMSGCWHVYANLCDFSP